MKPPKSRTKTKPNPGSAEFEIQLNSQWKRALPGLEKLAKKVALAAFEAGSKSKLKTPLVCCIRFAEDKEVKSLNHDFRGKPKPTNVLSFPALDWREGRLFTRDISEGSLGDIILARGVISKEAKAQKKTKKQHVTHLLVHGVLHLLGYDHMDGRQAAAMERLELAILTRFGVDNPYE